MNLLLCLPSNCIPEKFSEERRCVSPSIPYSPHRAPLFYGNCCDQGFQTSCLFNQTQESFSAHLFLSPEAAMGLSFLLGIILSVLPSYCLPACLPPCLPVYLSACVVTLSLCLSLKCLVHSVALPIVETFCLILCSRNEPKMSPVCGPQYCSLLYLCGAFDSKPAGDKFKNLSN